MSAPIGACILGNMCTACVCVCLLSASGLEIDIDVLTIRREFVFIALLCVKKEFIQCCSIYCSSGKGGS